MDAEHQELFTRDHGTVKVEESFQDGGYHIVRCPNGTYMHSNGLPIKDEKELRAAIPVDKLQKAIDWFRNRHEMAENPPQPITFDREGYPIFADGTPVMEFDDLYAYFQPGPILTAAIVALQEKKKKMEPQPGSAKFGAKAPAKVKASVKGKAKGKTAPAKKSPAEASAAAAG